VEKGTVSVIIPYFNGERYIAEAIESVAEQTYRDIELIVVDDGSADHSTKALRSCLGKTGIKYLRHDRNKGIPSARNTGIRASSGEYIAFLDQDDTWMPLKVEKQVAVLEGECRRGVGLVFSDVYYNYGGELTRENHFRKIMPADINMLPREKTFASLFMRDFIPFITTVIPRAVFETVGLLDEKIVGGTDDYDLCLRIAGRYRVHYIDEPLAAWRIHGGNYTHIPKQQEDQLHIIEKIIGLFPEIRALKRKKLSKVYESLGYYYCNVQDYKPAVKAYEKAVWERPIDITNSLKLFGAMLGLYAGPRAQRGYFELGKLAKKGISRLSPPGIRKIAGYLGIEEDI
jgi:glycosyltransferase involved in cell wall biosynthesis